MPVRDLFQPAQRREDIGVAAQNIQRQTEQPNGRVFRRIIGYHNLSDSDVPPDYADPDPQSLLCRSLAPSSSLSEPLPQYSCSVAAEGVLEYKMERKSPFESCHGQRWTRVYVILQGTMLQIRQAKRPGIFTPSAKRGTATAIPGKIIRSYTLQHAEVGLASDFKKIEMIPRTQMAQLLPEQALLQLMETDPSQFEMRYNYVVRMRVEETQILLRFESSELRSEWMDHLCAAVDIAPPLEARSEPRYHTLPRRRRRAPVVQVQTGPEGTVATTVVPASLVEQQERILRAHYPHLVSAHARTTSQMTTRPDNEAEAEAEADADADAREGADLEGAPTCQNEPDPDAEDLDGTFMSTSNGPDDSRSRRERGDIAENTHRDPLTDMSTTINDSSDAKWAPVIASDPAREARYRRRCMPMLVYNSRYASDTILQRGRIMRIDWDNERLDPAHAPPPAYRGSDAAADAEVDDDEPPSPLRPATGLRKLLRSQSSSADLFRNALAGVSRPNLVHTTTSSADTTDASGDDNSFSGPNGGAKDWGSRMRRLARWRDDAIAPNPPKVEVRPAALKRAKSADMLSASTTVRRNEAAFRRLGI